MLNHLEEVKRRHKKLMGPKKGKIMVSNDDRFNWLKWLNPQDGKSYVGARVGVKAAVTDDNLKHNEQALKKFTLVSFGKRVGADFNLWSDHDEQVSNPSTSTASNALGSSHASNASSFSHTTTPSTASDFSHTTTPFNTSHVYMPSLPYAT